MSEIDETADLGDDAEPESFAERPKQPAKPRPKRTRQSEPVRAPQTEAVFDEILASPGKEAPHKSAPASTHGSELSDSERVEAPATAASERASNPGGADSSAKAQAASPATTSAFAQSGVETPAPSRAAPAAAADAAPRRDVVEPSPSPIEPLEQSPIEPLEPRRHVAPRPRPASASARSPARSVEPAWDGVSEPAAPLPAPAPLPDPVSSPSSRRSGSDGTAHVAVQPRGGDFDVGYERRARPRGLGAQPSEAAADGLESAQSHPSGGGDLSRSPTLASGDALRCPFPKEAKRLGIEAAVVTLRVEVEADDRVDNVIILADPGDGFGREARRCALAKRWRAGLDRAGNAARRTTVVSVRFQRNG